MDDTEVPFPETGRSGDDILEQLRSERAEDIDWKSGRAFSLVYNVDEEDHERLLETVGAMFLHENALNPFKYRTLMRMEREVVAMAASLFGSPPRAGSMSSGGTESIFLAVHTARQVARDRGVEKPQILTATTAHPAFAKACHYLDVEQVRLPVGGDGRAEADAFADHIGTRTALVVGSAPCYPFGVIDPIPDLAALAVENSTLCHVDACLGGWLLPFWERLGEDVTPWDFRVEGVTSLSADIHKYGYCFKGASVVLYRDRELLEKQHFVYDDWPGGLYASATAAGTRSGAPIAGAWATITHLGVDGYLRLARRVQQGTRGFMDAIRSIEELEITAEPDMSVFEFGSRVDDIQAIGDVMDDRGWHLDRQQGGLHVMISPGHDRVVDDFASDLRAAVADHGEARGIEAIYGSVS
ncbi:MAG: putative sphingosine-1-phosphate lyase [Acidimicrobiales bacterium]|nr:MAG: aspartate aminotransferase family protein [Actinomycetota bacterium]MBV6507305.1 putative sphingosine-1-phosphate lyase [Acidimicrobiales bacterium]RIK04086.1 MAG: aspartate aminotransferase family protein [Acidobacteriota bacterium]